MYAVFFTGLMTKQNKTITATRLFEKSVSKNILQEVNSSQQTAPHGSYNTLWTILYANIRKVHYAAG